MQIETILIVDDEEQIRLLMEHYLKKNGYNVFSSHNGREAYKTYFNEKIDLIISDIRMPIMGGIELLKLIKKANKDTPFIIITGFSELLETKTAYEHGANGFLSKPFKMVDLLGTIKDCLHDFKNLDDISCRFHGIKIEEFITGSKMDYPIYIKLSDKKFVKIANRGEDIERPRIEKYKEKNINMLYITEEDHKKYRKFLKNISDAIEGNKINIGSDKKIEFLKVANNIIMENVFSKDLDAENFEEAKNIIGSTFKIVSDIEHMLKFVKSISETSDEIYVHSLSVSTLSVMLTKKLDWILEKNKMNIAMAGMFHDIGKKGMPKELLKKKLIDITYDEKKDIEKHTVLGASMLMENTKIASDIIDVALQHHENCLGTGYPNKMSKARIHPLSKIVAITNEFMNLIESNTETGEDKFYVALKRLIILKYKHFEPEYFRAFAKLFKYGNELLKGNGY